ncbi:MAG: hypothetical protein JO062_26550 [Bryobacterales bacterium]|nr:hypothetical protein [Bryobacterales bacterium]
MMLRPGEIVLLRMRFHQAGGSKVRPAVTLLETGDDDFVAAPITSQLRTTAYDLSIADGRPAGLNVPSSIRIHKLTVVPTIDVLRASAMTKQASGITKALACAIQIQFE